MTNFCVNVSRRKPPSNLPRNLNKAWAGEKAEVYRELARRAGCHYNHIADYWRGLE